VGASSTDLALAELKNAGVMYLGTPRVG
jgi:hypothetical protein